MSKTIKPPEALGTGLYITFYCGPRFSQMVQIGLHGVYTVMEAQEAQTFFEQAVRETKKRMTTGRRKNP